MHPRPLSPRLLSWALTTALLAPLGAQATNGYFSAGYGSKSQGIAGIGIALPQDGLAAAANPAGTAAVGNRLDLGLSVFAPSRDADIVGNGAGPDAHYSGNDKSIFFIPDVGYTRQLNASTAIGLAIYGNGGMNTDYGTNPYSRFGGTGATGVNLEQLFIAPSVAYKVNPAHTFGAAINIAHQRFAAKGLSLFDNASYSAAPGHVSNQGTDSSTGAGLHLGWLGQLSPELTVGASWSSKISGKFDKYRGLFANGGEFDIPENYGFGASYAATPATTLAAEVQTIRYSQVAAVGNSAASLFGGQALGSANGPGFGWRDVTVLKLGVQHQVNSALTLRGGVSVARQPVPQSETFFNILAPGVIRNHLTLGATWVEPTGGEWSAFYALGLKSSIKGNNSIPPAFGGGNANVSLKEQIIGASYSWKF